mmetsp:Transcript_70917/g.148346  ORF Transcript_70917/g.148346 Transcript_70917/m.148346 type:complete len:216 (-) Transcript_70917:1836-2483(-)
MWCYYNPTCPGGQRKLPSCLWCDGALELWADGLDRAAQTASHPVVALPSCSLRYQSFVEEQLATKSGWPGRQVFFGGHSAGLTASTRSTIGHLGTELTSSIAANQGCFSKAAASFSSTFFLPHGDPGQARFTDGATDEHTGFLLTCPNCGGNWPCERKNEYCLFHCIWTPGAMCFGSEPDGTSPGEPADDTLDDVASGNDRLLFDLLLKVGGLRR